MRRIIGLALLAMLAACGRNEDFDDLNRFVKSSDNMRGKVEPLPEVRPYEPFTYEAFDLSDPFKPRKLNPNKPAGGGVQPDLNRKKEALEAYALENLKMVGTVQRSGTLFALIKTPDNNIYNVKPGNYIGQNFGIITKVTETGVTLTEIVQDTAGDWTERPATLNLSEETTERKQK